MATIDQFLTASLVLEELLLRNVCKNMRRGLMSETLGLRMQHSLSSMYNVGDGYIVMPPNMGKYILYSEREYTKTFSRY